MNNKISFTKPSVVLVLLLTIVSSCQDLLKEEPYNQINTEEFYKSESDALSALTGAYAGLKSGTGYYRQIWLSNLFAASDQGTASFNHADFRTGTIANTDQNLINPWIEIYAAIRDANNVIAKVPKIEGMNLALQERIVGEARFLRGLHYFNLVRAWGPVPLRTQPVKQGAYEGLPLSSIVDVYSVVISDLTYAANKCWGKAETRNGYTNDLGRATSAAAHALLTKVYLHIASAKRTAQAGIAGNARYLAFPQDVNFYYRKAIEHADAMIASPGYQLTTNLEDWVDIFDPDNGNNPEMIFEIQGSSLAGQGTAVSNLFSPRGAGLSGGGFGGTNKLIGTFINNLIDKNDPRFFNSIIKEYKDATTTYVLGPNLTGYNRTITATGRPNGTLFEVYTAKYIDRSATTEYTSEQNWHVVRLADVYLMRAEAKAELNANPAMANADVNTLRTRVGMAPFNGTGMSMRDFRTFILRERAAELYMEGHRFFDLTRMGVYNEYCIIAHNATRGVRGPEDYTWPIPLIESAANGSF